MEYRLLLIGALMGVFAWSARRRAAKSGLKSAGEAGLWRGAFFALAAFSAVLVLAASYDLRAKYVPVFGLALPVGELPWALAAAAGAFVVGLALGRKGRDEKKRMNAFREDLEWADTVFSSALMAGALMMFALQAFNIPSGSMEKTLLIGDRLFVNKLVYGLRVPFSGKRVLAPRKPERGDIVVFRFPTDDPKAVHCGVPEYGNDLIKRVIGRPGQVIEVRDGRVFVDGKFLAEEPYAQWTDSARLRPAAAAGLSPDEYQKLWQEHRLDSVIYDQRDYFGPVRVPEGAYFVMGDNRDQSCDSRYWGPVEERYIKGAAWFMYWPPSRLGGIR